MTNELLFQVRLEAVNISDVYRRIVECHLFESFKSTKTAEVEKEKLSEIHSRTVKRHVF